MSSKTAIVTGASRGIGKQIAIELGRLGFNVVVAARTVTPHAKLSGSVAETVAAVEAAGGKALAVQMDVRVPEDIEKLVSATVAEFGGLDVLINNAADTSGGVPTLGELDVDEWRRQFETNLHGPLQLMKAALPVLQKTALESDGGGLIINMTSGAGDLVPLAEVSGEGGVLGGERLAYAASKAALNRLSNALAPELRAQHIAIVNVDPGFTRTELVDRMAARGVVDPSTAVPMSVPVNTVLYLVKSGDAMSHSGQILRAQDRND
ncbi:SDR family NAD(P)-dependent oxidoreductase [Jatrophihabitans sp. DSM 45814]